MTEAVKPRKLRFEAQELMAQLERLSVPNHSLSDDEQTLHEQPEERSISEATACEATKSLPEQVAAEGNFESCAQSEVSPSMDTSLYPHIDAADISMDVKEQECERSKDSTPVILLPCQEYTLPPPLESDCLRNLYINKSLDDVLLVESDFLLELSDKCDIENDGRNQFKVLLNRYLHFRSLWAYALDRFKRVCNDTRSLMDRVWTVEHQLTSVTGKCKDGGKVSLKYEFDQAEMDHLVTQELKETEDVLRWVVSEELPILAFDLAHSRNEINEYLLQALTVHPKYRGIPKSEPARLVTGSDLSDSNHTNQLYHLRSICLLLFDAMRQQHRATDSHVNFALSDSAKQLRDWLLLTAGTMVHLCRSTEHCFILMQLLRLPSQLMRPLLCLLNPPDPTVAWHRSVSVAEFLHQPEVELLMTLFALCLRPVREREHFVTIPQVCSSTEDSPILHQAPQDPPWTLVDSGGESDLEVSDMAHSQTQTLADIPPSPTGSFLKDESSMFISPRDLNRLLRQLHFERLIQLLAFDVTSPNKHVDRSPQSGLMTLLAFSDRLLDLISTCGDIYSHHVDAPKPRTHLGEWRILAKRLACLISLLVTAAGSRVRSIWTSGTCHTTESQRLLAQYDAFCLRAAQCLLSGCGLPSTHKDAVRLVCWRYLANLFPFGLVASQSKNIFLHLIISSVLLTWKPLSLKQILHVPERVVEPLHRALLSIGLNDLGLEAIISVLGGLAAIECRPIFVPSASAQAYQLPSLEADLVRCILCIIFGLTVFQSRGSIQESSRQSVLINAIPIVPECGRKQLAIISTVHASVALSLLFDLILDTGEQLSSDVSSSVLKPSILFSPRQFYQRPGTKELLLSLVAEAPLQLLQPAVSGIDRLIGWLEHQSPTDFTHLLARTVVHCLNWESVINVETGEPFLPFKCHVDLALVLARLLDKQLLGLSRWSSLTQHPAVAQILLSTKSSARSTVGLLLTSIGYRQLQLPGPGTVDLDHKSRELLHRSRQAFHHQCVNTFVHRRSRSQGPPADRDENADAMSSVLSWCVDLLLRLHLPGCATRNIQSSSPLAVNVNMTSVWRVLLSLNLEQNCLAAFLVISLNIGWHDPSVHLPAEVQLPQLFKTIVTCRQANLILRALSLMFHQRILSRSTSTVGGLLDGQLAHILRLHQHNQLYPKYGPHFLSLCIGCCLDACLFKPHHCHHLLQDIITELTRTECFPTLGCSVLLEAVLQVVIWIRHNYIPTNLGCTANLTRWSESETLQVFKSAVKMIHAERSAIVSTYWSSYLVALSSAAWNRSTQAIHDLKGRLLGNSSVKTQGNTEQICVSSSPLQPIIGRSVLASFWPDLCPILSISKDTNFSYPFWTLTILHLMDYEAQSNAEADQPREMDHFELNGMWARMVAVLSRHADELITIVYAAKDAYKCSNSSQESLTLLPLMRLLERILSEANVLPSSTTLNNDDTQEIAITHSIHITVQQLCLVQGVSLLDACPLDHPVFAVLLQAVLSEVLGVDHKSPNAPAIHTALPNSIPVGFLLLRCLPWSTFRPSFMQSPERSNLSNTGSQGEHGVGCSFMDVLLSKLRQQLVRVDSMTEKSVEQSKCLRIYRDVHNLLSSLESMASRNSYFNLDRTSTSLNSNFQRETIDSLLNAFDWREQTIRLQCYVELWNGHRLSAVTHNSSVSNVLNEFPKDAYGTLRGPHLAEHRYILPYYSLDDLLTASVSGSVPESIEQFPNYIQALHSSLAKHIQLVCDRMELLDQLRVNYRNALVPNLYRITTVRRSEQVECRSIIPTWMSGSKGCRGGAHLLCEYQTAILDENMQRKCQKNREMMFELLETLVDEAGSAANGVLLRDVALVRSGQISLCWSVMGLKLEFIVRHLVGLSRTVAMQSGNHGSVGKVEIVRQVGACCFEDLCRSLSGPLLLCPVSKKLMTQSIQQLAEEFLPCVPSGYERVLDLLVALPHLSAVLLPTFTPPSPQSAIVGTEPARQPHPLLSVYKRLMDVRFRCGSEVAWNLLQTINTVSWFVGEESVAQSSSQLTELLQTMYYCIKQTREVTEKSAETDKSLHELLLGHFESLLTGRLDYLLDTVCNLLVRDLCDVNALPIWICFHAVLEEEVKAHGSLPHSIEQLSDLLKKLCFGISQQPTTDLSSGTPFDQMLQFIPCDLVEPELRVWHVLVRELGFKLSVCVHEKHMTAVLAVSSIMEHINSIFGVIILSTARAELQKFITPESPGYVGPSCLTMALHLVTVILRRAAQGRPFNHDSSWSCLLFDSFMHWLMCTPFILDKSWPVSVRKPSSSLNSSSIIHRSATCPTELPLSVPLITVLCVVRFGTESDSGIHDYFRELSLIDPCWRPTRSILDELIGVLLQSHLLVHPFCEGPIGSAVVYLLELIEWTSIQNVASENYESVAIYPRIQTTCQWCPPDIRSTDPRSAFAETVTFLFVLLFRTLIDATAEIKNTARRILESVISNVCLVNVNDRCYTFILSHLSELDMPVYCVLMPPTTVEGRLLSLLATAGAMISNAESVSSITTTCSTAEHNLCSSVSQPRGLYPHLSTLCHISSVVPVLVHRKRLVYVRMIMNFLQCAIRCRDTIVTSKPEFLRVAIRTCLPMYESFEAAGDTKKATAPNYLTKTLGAIFDKIVPKMFLPTSAIGKDLNDTATFMEPTLAFGFLTWLRIGNLFSELESVAASAAWDSPSTPRFGQLVELCNEAFRFLRRHEALHSPSTLPVENAHALICDAVVHWLLGKPDFTISNQSYELQQLCISAMPRSINAGLSRPICYALLHMTHVDEECLDALVTVLESSMWSVIHSTPSNLDPVERLVTLFDLINHDVKPDQRVVTSNSLVHCCLREGALLPLLILTHNRACQLDEAPRNSNNNDILVADLLHWLNVVNLRFVAEGRIIRLHSFLLFVAFVVHTVTVRSGSQKNHDSVFCCSSHPGWKLDPKGNFETTDCVCPTLPLMSRLLMTLTNVRNSVAKFKTEALSSTSEAFRLISFIECLGSLIEAWFGTQTSRTTHFGLFQQQAHPVANLSQDRPPCTTETNVVSVISMMSPRLPSWTMNDALRFLIAQFWPHVRLQQLLTYWLK